MWPRVSSQSYRVSKFFHLGKNADEVMLYGTMAYKMESGRSFSVDWAARAHIANSGGFGEDGLL
jgi:hypothetical protein